MFRVPYSILPPAILQRFSHAFMGLAHLISPLFPFLVYNLKQAGINVKKEEYLSMCILASLSFFVLVGITLSFLFLSIKMRSAVLVALTISIILFISVFIQQIAYPKLLSRRRVRNIEQNLIPALQSMLVQLSSGVPLFNILANIASGGYGALSDEFRKVIKKIRSGTPQTDALEELALNNPSNMFRRSIWQIVTGMKVGSDLSYVTTDAINSLSEEQVIQIQKYGSSLNPLAMFYMLLAVIVPSLGITFVIVISSFLSLSEYAIKLVFWTFFGLIVFFQMIFIGLVKSRRPNLLQ